MGVCRVATYVDDHRQDGDLILLHGSYVMEAFRYYYRLNHEFRTSRDRASDLLGRQRVGLAVALANERDHYWRSFGGDSFPASRELACSFCSARSRPEFPGGRALAAETKSDECR